MEVTCDMPGLTSRAGSALLTGLADAVGLTDGLVSALSVHSRAARPSPSWRCPRLACFQVACVIAC